MTIYSIGHSNHSIESFLELLKRHQIEVVADVRSVPRSGYSPQFDHDRLRESLNDVGMKYVLIGRELGGRPPEFDYYDPDGHVRYDLVARSARFLQGIERLLKGAHVCRIAIMCSEEDPAVCHRHLLISRVLAYRQVQVLHIRRDGLVEHESALAAGTREYARSLFDDEEHPWRSIQSVLRKRPRKISSSASTEPASND